MTWAPTVLTLRLVMAWTGTAEHLRQLLSNENYSHEAIAAVAAMASDGSQPAGLRQAASLVLLEVVNDGRRR